MTAAKHKNGATGRFGQVAVLNDLGPGLITGAADDDPSGIATYSQAGAQSGFNLLWTMVLTFPLMVAIQMISALIGRVTGHGLARNMGDVLPHWLVTGLVTLLIIFMGFIVWDLAKKSKAGRFGSFILFFVLGLGVAAFIIKSVVIGLIESGAL